MSRSRNGSRSHSAATFRSRTAFARSRTAAASASRTSRCSRTGARSVQAPRPSSSRAALPGRSASETSAGGSASSGDSRRRERRARSRSATASAASRSAYDDVVDVNLKMWGDEWEQSLGRLTATTSGPGEVVRAWGHPVWVRGDVTLAGPRALLRALDVPAGQFVELRTLYPRGAFSSTAGMRVEDGPGLAKIVAEEQADAEEYAKDQERIDELKVEAAPHGSRRRSRSRRFPRSLVIAAVFWFLGRERRTGVRPGVRAGAADRHRARARPDAASAGRRGRVVRVHGDALRPDPARRLHGDAATTERKIWGGLRTQTVSDLELSAGERGDLTPWEDDVAKVVDCGAGRRIGATLELSRPNRGRAGVDVRALRVVQGGSRTGGRPARLVPLDRRPTARRRGDPVRARGSVAPLPRAGRLALGLSALLRRRARRRRHQPDRQRRASGRNGRLRASPVAQAIAVQRRRRPSAGTPSAAT